MNRFALLAALIVISGCAPTCRQDSIAGNYELETPGGLLILALNKDGSGHLLRGHTNVAAFTWEWVADNDQVFLNISREVWEILREASDGAQLPPDVPYIERLHHGTVPVCGPDGVPDRLNLDLEGRYYFTRVAD